MSFMASGEEAEIEPGLKREVSEQDAVSTAGLPTQLSSSKLEVFQSIQNQLLLQRDHCEGGAGLWQYLSTDSSPSKFCN